MIAETNISRKHPRNSKVSLQLGAINPKDDKGFCTLQVAVALCFHQAELYFKIAVSYQGDESLIEGKDSMIDSTARNNTFFSFGYGKKEGP